MESINVNQWLAKALAILTNSPKPMSAKELHEQAGDDIPLSKAVLVMKHAAADHLVEAHKRANKKATLFTAINTRVDHEKAEKEQCETSKELTTLDEKDLCIQLVSEMHTILQHWLTDIAAVDAQLAEALLKIKHRQTII